MESIIDASNLISSIIGNVLDMSRIEAGKIELALGKFSVLNILERVGELFSSMAFKKGLRLRNNIKPNMGYRPGTLSRFDSYRLP